MSRIILIETATSVCSVALAENGKVVASRISDDPRAHASLTAPFVKEVLDGESVSSCDAVCVSKGPGSYTGLRVGVSTAKGLCFGAGIPLLSAGTLDSLVSQASLEDLLPEGCRHVVPMIDARRMEVYCAVFTPDGRQLTQTAPTVVEGNTFDRWLSEGPVLFIGDGAEKCRRTIVHPNAVFVQCNPVAASLAPLAEKALQEKRLEDVAYFEPFYLKQFTATVSRKKLF